MSGASSSSAGFVLAAQKSRFPRTASTGFFVLNGLHLGMAIFDLEMTSIASPITTASRETR